MNKRFLNVTVLVLVTSQLGLFSSIAVAAPSKAQQRARVQAQAAAPEQGSRGSTKALNLQRSQMALPQSQAFGDPAKKTRSLEAVKPPKSGDLYEANTKEAEYEMLLDKEIAQLYKLSRQSKKSSNRGEVWLRLGERYVEKAKVIDMREQAEYEKRLKDFAEKKTKIRPQLNQKAAREYNEKAVQLYEWFIKDFPNDPKVDQALFFLGYNQFELGNTQLGERYYIELTKRYPDSMFVTESHFALGEYYFENENWKQALENYAKVIKVKKARLNTFALYKSSWCLYRLSRTKVALQALEKVIRQSRAAESADNGPGRRSVNKLRLAGEAIKDYVPFYAEVGDPKEAASEFQRLTGSEKQANQMLERLAFIYADSGNRVAANYIFKQLIGKNPTGERAAEYQYQVVLAYATVEPKEFRKELDIWLESFGPKSFWAKENAANKKLVEDATRLQETTLRNFVLQQHQTAQNSRVPFAQQVASAYYSQYFKYFSDSPKIAEMMFFHGELLFDMEKYEDAAKHYLWVLDKDPKGPYAEKAIVNSLLALEKDLPPASEIDKKRGNSTEKMPLDPPVQRFEKAALRYIQAFPKGEKTSDIRRRLGVLYYSYNHFDEAQEVFEKLLFENPKSENAEVAGNLILDIYKLKNDMAGLADKGAQFLANPAIASSKFGAQVRTIMEKASYLRAEKTAASGDTAKAAKEFEAYATTHKSSDLAAAARYNAATNYEKAGDMISAIRMYNMVMLAQTNDPKIKTAQTDSRNALARIYQQTGQLEAAAKLYMAYATANPKDQKAINAYYNAGVLYDGLGETNEAMQAYQAYFDNSNRADRVEVLYAQAEILRKKGQLSKASNLYDKYLQAGPRSQSQATKSAYMIAQIAEQQNLDSRARYWYKKTLEMYNGSKGRAREETVKYAAEARFIMAQDVLKELAAVRFGTSDKTQANAAKQVQALRERYINEMKDVIRFDHGPYIIAALASTGKMFDSIARVFEKVQPPNGLNPEEANQYKGLLQREINKFKAEAKNSYKSAVDKSHELEAYSTWTQVAISGLAAHDTSVVDAGEVAADARAADWMGL
jgi:tetratricopeptide (TPR) repeat protein